MYSLAARGKIKDQRHQIQKPLLPAPPSTQSSFASRHPSSTTFPSHPSPAPRSATWGKQPLAQTSAPINPPAFVFQPLVTVSFVSSLEDAMRNALQSFFPSRTDGPTGNSRQEFYDKFQREANGHDNDFTEKYDSDLDTTLIFVSVLSYLHIGCGVNTFSWGVGRSILCGHVRFHRRYSDQSPTGLHTIELRHPPDYSQQHQHHAYPNWSLCPLPSMDWS